MRVRRDRVRVRQIRGAVEGAAALTAVFDGLSPRSRHLRFHTPMPRLSSGMRAALLDVDGDRHVVLVAEARTATGWRPVGLGRFVRTGPDEAGQGIRGDLRQRLG